jgi:outer membrane protein OmpA-like peptidoglycan-associated protein
VDALTGMVADLDHYKELRAATVTFAFDRAVLSGEDRKKLDDFASTLSSMKSYILQVTGGTDSTGYAQYNYQLSQRRADAVVSYLSSTHGIPPHKFYLIGIGKDVQVASDRSAQGRARNRRVEIKLLSNMNSPVAGNADPMVVR